jgi:hypothetical protein
VSSECVWRLLRYVPSPWRLIGPKNPVLDVYDNRPYEARNPDALSFSLDIKIDGMLWILMLELVKVFCVECETF